MKRTFFVVALTCLLPFQAVGRTPPRPASPVKAFVVDERLSAVRQSPGLSPPLMFRARRGRPFTVLDWKAADGLVFLKVKVSSKRTGWIQWDAVVIKGREGEDVRLLRLVAASDGFERIDRARIFLEVFPASGLRAPVLLILGDSAQEAALKLSRDVVGRVPLAEVRPLAANDSQLRSFYLGNAMLDRYSRIGVRFEFDLSSMRFRYDGAAWREILARHPQSSEADIVRGRSVGEAGRR